jgi:SAM-dependent methyltransferase
MQRQTTPLPGKEQQECSDEQYGDFVELAYQTVLRRKADAAGKQAYIKLMERGASAAQVLRTLAGSEEFSNKVLVQRSSIRGSGAYDIHDDPAIARYMTPQTRELTDVLTLNRSVNRETFSITAKAALDEMKRAGVLGDQGDYLAFHHDRFWEIANSISGMIACSALPVKPQILDFGFSVNSFILRSLFGDTVVSVCDRPEIQGSAKIGFESFVVDLVKDDLDRVDFKKRFDLIVFAEVIEHVLVNPVKVMRFLLRHTTKQGKIMITTPNCFSHNKLAMIAVRKNPQPIYPEQYSVKDSPHFHVREYSMGELLELVEQAGGQSQAFFFSDCWDDPSLRAVIPYAERSNMVVVIGEKKASV